MIALAWLSRLLAVLGIPTWVPVVLLAGALAVGGAYVKGRMDGATRCHDAELRAVIASMQRDLTAQSQAQELEASQQAALEAQRQQLEEQVKDYEAALKIRPAAACALTDDDIGRLSGKRK